MFNQACMMSTTTSSYHFTQLASVNLHHL